MSPRLYFHTSSLRHDPPPVKGMGPARMYVICENLRTEPFDDLAWKEAPAASEEEIATLHLAEYIEKVKTPLSPEENIAFDAETYAVEGTSKAAFDAVGQVLQATRDVVSGEIASAFCIVSPGGHHAEADRAEGFCFFNHIALAAVEAQQKLGLKRVAVLDFDAHHGNGTQSFFWNFEERLYVSLHEDSPLSGFVNETGAWNNVLNIPLPEGTNGLLFRKTVEEQALPKIEAFAPDILFVSAGFDMLADDPMAHLYLTPEDYAWLGRRIARFAREKAQDRLVCVLEGGYNIGMLGKAVAAFVGGMKEARA